MDSLCDALIARLECTSPLILRKIQGRSQSSLKASERHRLSSKQSIQSMASPTRDEFLSHVHQGLVHPETDPEEEGITYEIDTALSMARAAALGRRSRSPRLLGCSQRRSTRPPHWAVPPGYWDVVQLQLDSYTQPLTSEPGLRVPFSTAFQIPHNLAIRGAGDVHAEMWTEGSQPDPQPIANADFIMVYDGKLCGLIELKTWWKVTEAEIEEVRQGT